MAAGQWRADLAGVEKRGGGGGMPAIELGRAIYRPKVSRISKGRSSRNELD